MHANSNFWKLAELQIDASFSIILFHISDEFTIIDPKNFRQKFYFMQILASEFKYVIDIIRDLKVPLIASEILRLPHWLYLESVWRTPEICLTVTPTQVPEL